MIKQEIGFVTKPQGLKGDFRLKYDVKFLNQINNIKQIEIFNQTYTIEKITDRGGFWVVKVKELTDINQVELLRNYVVYASFDEEVTEENNFVGYKVVSSTKTYGEILEVNNYGSVDVVTLSNKTMFALTPDLYENIDDSGKIITVSDSKMAEVLV